ncbi:hypothetical protein C7S20_03750 [Christiangramia fulva]|uniref:Uncharacterized protein n=1 Tax=Christiangramia fulva TaxID=2126553 RepID=A0A2R3Z2F6_9FLAO|nr:hypothetical protein [Christiangramia fulva]AVR44444.1 hypothetical protein C7S20_03750 [Christiangramia fulva]
MKTFILLLLLTFNPFPKQAQEDCPCCSSEHHEFDFWIGEWEVFNEKGDKIGENLVEALEDHCIISENWKGATGTSGKSFSYYDSKDQTWNQLWISNSGNILKLKGTASKGKMVLKSDLQESEKGKFYNQVTWTKNPDGSVTQNWILLDENGKKIGKAFKGIYKKKN